MLKVKLGNINSEMWKKIKALNVAEINICDITGQHYLVPIKEFLEFEDKPPFGFWLCALPIELDETKKKVGINAK